MMRTPVPPSAPPLSSLYCILCAVRVCVVVEPVVGHEIPIQLLPYSLRGTTFGGTNALPMSERVLENWLRTELLTLLKSTASVRQVQLSMSGPTTVPLSL